MFSSVGLLYVYRKFFFQNILQTKPDDRFKVKLLIDLLGKRAERDKFNDLIALAKSNSPEFLILFKELYPQFIYRLKELDPKVRSSELSFCAMAYLNFSSKDIAEYTFVTVRAVQIRKNRLRKKYNIPSDEDFNSWMRKLKE